jgi:uncharacterized SAM-binding protein YcdF (DUF218 family)
MCSRQIESRLPVPAPSARCRWLRRLLWLAAFCFLLSAFCFVFRAPLLTGLAKVWIVNDPPAKADAIVVLGGGIDTRPAVAAELYARGLAPKVLVSNVQRVLPGTTLSEAEATRRILLTNQVPESAILLLGTNNTTTHDESVAARDWVRQAGGVKTVVVVTDLFHTRRVRWAFRKELRGTGTTVRLEAVPRANYQANNWWRHEQGVIDFETEVCKFAYYWVKY